MLWKLMHPDMFLSKQHGEWKFIYISQRLEECQATQVGMYGLWGVTEFERERISGVWFAGKLLDDTFASC